MLGGITGLARDGGLTHCWADTRHHDRKRYRSGPVKFSSLSSTNGACAGKK